MKTRRSSFKPGKVKMMGDIDSGQQYESAGNGPMPMSSPDMNLPGPGFGKRKKKANREPSQWVASTQIDL